MASYDEAAAEKAYRRRCLRWIPTMKTSLNGLAMVYADRGDLPERDRHALAIIDRESRSAHGRDAGGILRAAYLKDFPHAADTMKQALALTNDNRVRQQLAVDLYAAGRFYEAVAAFQELAADDPIEMRSCSLRLRRSWRGSMISSEAEAAPAKARAIENPTGRSPSRKLS